MSDLPDLPRPAEVVAADTPSLRTLAGLATGVVVVAALYLGRDVLVPIMLAVLLSFVLAPLAGLLHRIGLPRVPATLLAVLVAMGVIVGLGTVIGGQVAGLAGNAPRYAETVQDKLEGARSSTLGRLPGLIGGFTARLEHAGERAAPAPAERAADDPAPIPVTVQEESSPFEVAARVLEPILSPLETTVIVLVVAIFILLQRDDLRDRMIRLFGSSDLQRTTTAMDEAAARLSRYFLTQLALNSLFGLVVGLGLWWIGVPSAALWGVLAAFMRFIPYVGAFLAAFPPLLLAAAVDPGWTMALLVVALFLISEPVMGYVVEPMVYGHSTGLSPVSVVVAAIFWTWLWGPIGLILSTPLTLCLVVLGRHVERLEFLDVLLGDRPALTPVESFYQRMLAGDADEALDQAEDLLKARPLSTYYDEIAVPGLQLAAADCARGVMGPEAMERVRGAIWELIGDLADHRDGEPPDEADDPLPLSLSEQAVTKSAPPAIAGYGKSAVPPAWAAQGAILCLSGRGPLDPPASAMLAQLLDRQGLGTRTASVEAASRQRLAGLDTAGVVMVCITYLEISGSPSHLRYLLRRLRQKLPGVPIIVGLWPADDRTMTDPQVRALVGADVHVSTLGAAVEACLLAAAGGNPNRLATAA